jgi:hypothetical protein
VDLILHSLRHTAASVLLNDLDASIDGVRRLLRHRPHHHDPAVPPPGEQADAPAFTLAAALRAEIVSRRSARWRATGALL